MVESGLFSFADYRHSPGEILLLPDFEGEGGIKRKPVVIHRGDYELFSNSQMRDLAAMYARAQKAAMPIAREMWEIKETQRTEKIRNENNPNRPESGDDSPDLFAADGT